MMHPILATFSIGGTEVVLRAYGTFYVLAWLAAVVIATVVAHRTGTRWWRALIAFVAALLAGIVGARLLDLAVNWAYYSKDTGRVFQLSFGGFSFYGGLILGLVVGALVARALRVDLWRLGDSALPGFVAGIVLMRTGCFLNGCCFGKITTLPWGVTFPAGSPAWAQQAETGQSGLFGFMGKVYPVHPTEIYEMIAALVFGGLALWLLFRRRTPPGIALLAFLFGFTLFRLGNDFLRATLPSFRLPGWFFPVIYVAVCAALAVIMAWRLRAARSTIPSPTEGGTVDQ